MNGILTTGVVAVVSVAAGFLGSFLLLRRQIAEARKERVRDRKIRACSMKGLGKSTENFD